MIDTCQRLARKCCQACLPSSLQPKWVSTTSTTEQDISPNPSTSSITLYDLTRSGPRSCWSPNTWKTRYTLNYKGLDYTTHWLEYPDIAPVLEAAGFTPNATGSAFTVPALSLKPGGQQQLLLMDSRAIATALEAAQPLPSLHLESPLLAEVQGLLERIMPLIGPVALPLLARSALGERSAAWMELTHAPRFGMGLAQLEREKGGEAAWERLRGPLRELAAVLRRNEGPYVMGETMSYADFVVAGFLQAGRRIGDGVMYRRVVEVDEVFGTVLEATREWAKRDDY